MVIPRIREVNRKPQTGANRGERSEDRTEPTACDAALALGFRATLCLSRARLEARFRALPGRDR
jgi:hypothetical protein